MVRSKVSRDEGVNAYIRSLKSPYKEDVIILRAAILSADKKIKDSIKWGMVTFTAGRNIASIMVAKDHLTVVFFEGSKMKSAKGSLKGKGTPVRSLKIGVDGKFDKVQIRSLVKQAVKLSMIPLEKKPFMMKKKRSA